MLATRTPYFGFIPGNILFLVVLIFAWVVFARRVYHLYRLMRLGGPDERSGEVRERVNSFLAYVLGQRRMFQEPWSGLMHALIFWGFLVVTIMTLTFWVGGIFPSAPVWVVDQNPVFLPLLETFEALVIIATVGAFVRRLFVHPNRLTYNADALLILGLILILMLSALFENATSSAYDPQSNDRFGYVSYALSGSFAGWDRGALLTAIVVFWWIHNLTVLWFLTYLPVSKHLHIITSGFNVFFRSTKPKGQLSYVDIEKAFESETPRLGVGEITDLSWKNLLDLYTCTECGRCEAQCPASRTGKPLSPKKLILDLKEYLLDEGPQIAAHAAAEPNGAPDGVAKPRLVGDVILDDVLWDCTSCRACMQACPVFIEHVPKIVDMRRNLVLVESRFGQDVQRLFDNLEASGNPWRFPAMDRDQWARGLNVPVVGENATVDDVDVLYWVGCAGSFDERNQAVARSFVQLCRAAGVRVGILGKQETCTGDPARRAGNEYLFQVLAGQNVQTMNGLGVKQIVATCPHCCNMILNEYPQLGGHYQVQHHSQFLDHLLASGRLRPTQHLDRSLAYHDPCYLGRYQDVYDEPRRVLSAIPGIEVKEVHDACREKGMCCGGGGARVFMDESRGRRINHLRVEQLQGTDPEGVATGCPYCIIMLEDATSTKGIRDELPVLDISEVLLRSLDVTDGPPPPSGQTTQAPSTPA